MPLRRHFALPGHLALLAAIALALLWPAAVDAALWWPLLASLVVLGLPHGAVDHHVPARLGRAVSGSRFLAAYVALAAAVLALWWVAPGAALAVFLAVAAVHWGLGDVWFARRAGGRAPFARHWRLVAFVAARGLLPVALPLLAFPAAAAEGTGAILAAVGTGDADWAPDGAFRTAGLAVLAAAVGAALVASLLDHRGLADRRGARLDAAELGLLVVTFLLVPPVFAVGVYFTWWHALRHVGRLIAASPAQARLLAAHRPTAALARWHREAAPCTLASLAGLAILASLVWEVPAAGPAVTGAALALIAALTVPHALVVAWMDRVQLASARSGMTTTAVPALAPARRRRDDAGGS